MRITLSGSGCVLNHLTELERSASQTTGEFASITIRVEAPALSTKAASSVVQARALGIPGAGSLGALASVDAKARTSISSRRRALSWLAATSANVTAKS